MTGLSFDLTEEQEQLRQAVRDFAERECPMTTKASPADGGYVLRGTKIWSTTAHVADRIMVTARKARLRQRIADELAAGSVTEAPRMSRPAAQAESA